ncbi:hypothetical protein P22_1308 [Propionispora sp. 2/2-37]|uniref:methyltransferase domain-containing protein n=1 Tax=Propionispora sp. 2/2-37 TaxID=1677858 RepID=UPI0006BB5967|nr:methyltransferase domain-containing protein [Propionispora sp. 2/2-37]CUH95238.1 hypothetical protein P22_1308 [Propionispora sp. 2/2-37]
MESALRLLILALDGADPHFIERNRDDLANISMLIQEGTWGCVAGPPFSYDRWFSYYSGLTPEQHGMEALRVSTTGRVTLRDANVQNFLWDYAANAGLRFGMLGGLGCEPPRTDAGFWVNFYFDQFYPEQAGSFCTNLWTPIFPYPVCDEIATKPWKDVNPEAIIASLERYDWNQLIAWAAQRQARQRDMLDALMARWPVDVLWYYGFELDWSQHIAAHRPDVLVPCYQIIDQTLGHLLEKYRPDNVLVVSDHGLIPIGTDMPYPNLKVLPGVGACLPLEDRQAVWTGEHYALSFYVFSGPGVEKNKREDIDFMQIFPLIMKGMGVLSGTVTPEALPAGVPQPPLDDADIWEIRAPLYSRLQWVEREDLLNFMISHCQACEKDRVLDLGTGTGIVAAALASKAGCVIGIDKEPAMLEQAKTAWPQVEFRQMDIQKLDLPDQYVDLVTARMVLHHVNDIARALSEARRVLTAGGRIVLCEGIPPSESVLERYKQIFALKEPGRHIFTEALLLQLLDEAGFTDLKAYSCLIPQISLKNWLSGSGLSQEVCDRIEELHRSADRNFWETYNMKESGDDLLMDWKFAVVTASRGLHQV